MRLAAILGPTAAGKSEVALHVAEAIGAEIISVDSIQVYRGMDIGTAKPSMHDRQRVPHHMIDVVDPEHAFSVAEFQRLGRQAMADIDQRDAVVLIVGGSGLHFRSLVDPLEFPPTDSELRAELEALPIEDVLGELLAADPQAVSSVDVGNPRRVVRALEVFRLTGLTPTARASSDAAEAVRGYRSDVPVAAVGLDPVDALPVRVAKRFDRMLESGFVEEVEGMRGRLGPTAATAVGYRQVMRAVEGEWDLQKARERAIDATTSLARRQRTYHRRDPRIEWLDWQDDPVAMAGSVMTHLQEAGWSS